MSAIVWLLVSDPSIRWQVMRDLIAESDATVARERSRVAAEGWGARLLTLQGPDGHWGGAAFVPHAWISTTDTLQLLRDLGVDPTSDRVRRAIDQVRDRCTWGEEFGDAPSRAGTTTSCGDWTTCGGPASHPTSAWPRRSIWCGRSATNTGGGRSRTRIRVRCTSRWKTAPASRAAGTPFERSACCAGRVRFEASDLLTLERFSQVRSVRLQPDREVVRLKADTTYR